MSKKFWRIVNKVIGDSDVVLLVLDARLINETRNAEVEKKVREAEKPLIYVITKSDLVSREKLEKIKLKPSVHISAKEHHGTNILRERIIIEGKKIRQNQKLFYVGVLGYPNVGKSSLINAMNGRKSAPASPVSGFTKHVQKVKSDNRIMFLDTPGVVPYEEKDTFKHILIGTIGFDRIRDPDIFVMKLMEEYPGRVEKHYGVEVKEDLEETIEAIAQKKKMLKKGGKSDIERVSKLILRDWQTGQIDE